MGDSSDQMTVVLITNDGMGQAETELRHKLIKGYLQLLHDNDMLPGAICFYGQGVKLVVDGSPVLDVLSALETKGVHLTICSTCLDHFGLADQVRVGYVGGMADITAAQWSAAKVITL